jgi:hypothetical protein
MSLALDRRTSPSAAGPCAQVARSVDAERLLLRGTAQLGDSLAPIVLAELDRWHVGRPRREPCLGLPRASNGRDQECCSPSVAEEAISGGRARAPSPFVLPAGSYYTQSEVDESAPVGTESVGGRAAEGNYSAS